MPAVNQEPLWLCLQLPSFPGLVLTTAALAMERQGHSLTSKDFKEDLTFVYRQDVLSLKWGGAR